MAEEDTAAPLLFVEDEVALRRAASRAFEDQGYEVVGVGDVEEALQVVHERAHWLGFIVDHRLPEPEGLGLIESLREEYPRVPVVLATGELSAELSKECFRRRVPYLVKPYTVADIIAHLRASIADPVAVLRRGLDAEARRVGVTPSELEVLELYVIQSYGRREIAEFIGISENSVKSRIRSALQRTGDDSLSALRIRLRETSGT